MRNTAMQGGYASRIHRGTSVGVRRCCFIAAKAFHRLQPAANQQIRLLVLVNADIGRSTIGTSTPAHYCLPFEGLRPVLSRLDKIRRYSVSNTATPGDACLSSRLPVMRLNDR